MKKILSVICALALLITLVACGTDTKEPDDGQMNHEPLTNFELVKKTADELSIPNAEEIRKNIYLPKSTKDEVMIVWTTSNAKAITPEGYVTRSTTSDQAVTLTATLSFGSTVERRSFDVNVKQIPSSIEAQVQEYIQDFILYENNYVDRDILILPRTSDINGVYIEWQSSNTGIIDLDGNVYRTQEEQKVTLTGSFIKEDVKLEKEIEVTVGSTADDEPELITESDPRILNKIYVKNTEELLKACVIDDLKPGDAVILEDGKYDEITLYITDSGTFEHPIFLFAKNPGKVTITGESRVDVVADYVTVANLTFQ